MEILNIWTFPIFYNIKLESWNFPQKSDGHSKVSVFKIFVFSCLRPLFWSKICLQVELLGISHLLRGNIWHISQISADCTYLIFMALPSWGVFIEAGMLGCMNYFWIRFFYILPFHLLSLLFLILFFDLVYPESHTCLKNSRKFARKS